LPYKSREAKKAHNVKYRAENRERCRQLRRSSWARNLEHERKLHREWQRAYYHSKLKHDPTYMAKQRAFATASYRANPERAKRRNVSYARNALIVPRQTPKWANKFFISEIYDLAKLRTKYLGMPHQVDHIIPLCGRDVCGLHVETNLRVVTKAINLAKGNAFEAPAVG